jgi:hypothetical protein
MQVPPVIPVISDQTLTVFRPLHVQAFSFPQYGGLAFSEQRLVNQCQLLSIQFLPF